MVRRPRLSFFLSVRISGYHFQLLYETFWSDTGIYLQSEPLCMHTTEELLVQFGPRTFQVNSFFQGFRGFLFQMEITIDYEFDSAAFEARWVVVV